MFLIGALLVTGAQATPAEAEPFELIANIIAENSNPVTHCYEVALRSDRTLTGKIVFRWSISGGKSHSIIVMSNETSSDSLARCVIEKIESWSFDPSITEDIEYPFMFSQKDMPSETDPSVLIREPTETEPSGLINEAVAKHFKTAGRCYDTALNSDPSISGRMVFRWSISDGKSHSITVVSNDTGSDSMADCIVSKIKTWSFDPSITSVIEYPFVFRAMAPKI